MRASRVLIFAPASFTQAVSRTVCAPSGLFFTFVRDIVFEQKEAGHAASSEKRAHRV